MLSALSRKSDSDPRIGLEGMRHSGHEEDVPAEQSAAQADPRLPGEDEDQGRPPRAQAAPPERPKAHRGLSGGAWGVVVRAPAAAPARGRVPAGSGEGRARARATFPPGRDPEHARPRPTGIDGEPKGRRRGHAEPSATAPSGELSPPAHTGAGPARVRLRLARRPRHRRAASGRGRP